MQPDRHRVRPARGVPNQHRDVLAEAVPLAEHHEAGVLGMLQRHRTVADMGDLDALVRGQCLDLQGGHGEDRPAGQPRAQLPGSPAVYRNPHDGRQQPPQPRQGESARLRRRGRPGIELRRTEPAGRRAQAQNLFGPRRPVQPQAQIPGRTAVDQAHGLRPVVGHGETGRRVEPAQGLEGLLTQRLHRRQQHARLPGGIRRFGDIERPSLPKVEQPAFRLVHASNHCLAPAPPENDDVQATMEHRCRRC